MIVTEKIAFAEQLASTLGLEKEQVANESHMAAAEAYDANPP